MAAKMDVSIYKASGIFDKELEDELMKFTTKSDNSYEVGPCLVEKSKEVYEKKNDAEVNITKCTKSLGKEVVEVESGVTTKNSYELGPQLVDKSKEIHGNNNDVEVNITECTKYLGNEVIEIEGGDTTENSSSFDNSGCGVLDTSGDPEVSSGFRGDAESALDFDGFGEIFRARKKKPTAQWRSFIQPLIWRCKWVELQIKKFQSQAQRYDREVKAYNKSKQIQLENSTTEGVCAKSLPFSRVNAKVDYLRRKKRKRAEATADLAAYMSHHNLFSYYENNRKGFTEGVFKDNEPKNPVNIDDEFWINDTPLFMEPEDGDNSFEDVLRKIDFLQSQVNKMKSRVDWVISENAEKISFSDNLSLPMMEYNTSDVLVHESAVTSHGNRSTDYAHENGEDGVLFDNEVKEEMNDFEEVKIINSIQRPFVIKDEPVNPSRSKLCSISRITAPKNKRKRGRRKGPVRRSRRSLG